MADYIMEPYIYDPSFVLVGILDAYESLIWNEKYNEVGDFEIVTNASKEILSMLKIGYYLVLNESDVVMIIETVELNSDIDEGDKLTISGRSFESILDRRVVWSQTDFNEAGIEDAIDRLLNDSIISPTKAERKIPNFSFAKSNNPGISSIKVTRKCLGDTLLDVILDFCSTNDIGFKITVDINKKTYTFKLYIGEDRTYDQTKNSFVAFSPNFDNLISSNYTESQSSTKNVTEITGDGEGADMTVISVGIGTPSGLERKEMYVNASDISRTKEKPEGSDADTPDEQYTKEEYENLLIARGRSKMYETLEEKMFEGETDTLSGEFIYGRDFSIGDIVQVENSFGLGDRVRITEFVRSCNQDGYSVYPTFKSVTQKESEVISE